MGFGTRLNQSSLAKEQLITSNSAEKTEQFGHNLAQQLKPGDVLAFFGDLGSGKTTLIKGICEGLEVEADITSPTFTLIHEYSGRLPVYHFDFYRIANSHEVWELGCDEYFYGDGVCLIEWADRVADVLPDDHLRIEIAITGPSEREFQITATGPKSERLLSRLEGTLSI